MLGRKKGRDAEGSASPLMRFADYCFAYADVPVLSHVDLDVAAGESVVLVGDNGSGKSTLLKAMNGLVFPQQGSYSFDGRVVDRRSMSDRAFAKLLHKRVGFVFQNSDAQLFCPTVYDEVAFGPRQTGLDEAEVGRRVDDVLAMIGLDGLRERAPYNLSGGEQKKVAIACVLSTSPDVYCFDEPLNGLDRKTREWLVGFLGQLKAAGKTLVLATHDMGLATGLADRYVLFGDEPEDGLPGPFTRVNA